MSTQIYVKCIDQTLTLVSTPLIASGGINEDVVNFTFCQKWEDFSKTAVFYRTPENVYYSLLDSDNVCVIPQEVLKEDGYLYFGVFGSNANGVTRTSEVIKYKVEKGAITENIKPSDPTPSIYEQILAKFQEIKEAETEFEANITARQDAVEKKQTEFEKTISKQQNDYEADVNKQWSTYKTNLTKQQSDYETDLSGQWTDYKTELTNQQTIFETSTTEKLNTYEDNVESIAETSANNAINTASQGKTVTLSTTWQYDSTNAYYTQNVTVVGMKATDKPILGIETSGNASDINSLRKEWAKVIQAETYDGGIKFYAKSATTKNLTVVIKPELSKVTVNEMSSEDFAKQVIVNAIYPVGSIYMSVNDVNPTTLFGGTWEKIKDRFLLASGDSYSLGATGGEATHTLTIDEMPTHLHGANYNWGSEDKQQSPIWAITMTNGTGDGIGSWPSSEGAGSTGGSQPHNNLPPYLVINIWKRTA